MTVKVDNAADARPQIGLAESKLLIEAPVEGGLTRYSALYLGVFPSLVGPVRSLRPVDADLLSPFPSVIVSTGGQRHVVGAVAATGSVMAGIDEPGLFQSLERPRPHHLFASPGAAFAEVLLPLKPPWLYGEWAGGQATTSISIPMGGENIEWRWEESSWIRYANGEQSVSWSGPDGPSSPISRDTLILLFAHQKSAGYTDTAGAEVPTFDVVGGGEVWVLHAGERVIGTWHRSTQADSWTLLGPEDSTLAVPTGSLYLLVVPAHVTVEAF